MTQACRVRERGANPLDTGRKNGSTEKRGRTGSIRRFLGLLFVLVVLLLNWPLLTIPFSIGIFEGLVYLFGLWALVILVLFLAARRIAARSRRDEP